MEAEVRPSEDPKKVEMAILSVLPGVACSMEGGVMRGGSSDAGALQKLYIEVRARRILGVLRRQLLAHASGQSTLVYLNKQAAFVGIPVVCEEGTESPMGPILLRLTSPALGGLVDWLAPTAGGGKGLRKG